MKKIFSDRGDKGKLLDLKCVMHIHTGEAQAQPELTCDPSLAAKPLKKHSWTENSSPCFCGRSSVLQFWHPLFAHCCMIGRPIDGILNWIVTLTVSGFTYKRDV